MTAAVSQGQTTRATTGDLGPGPTQTRTGERLQSVTAATLDPWTQPESLGMSRPRPEAPPTHLELRVNLSDHAEVEGVQDLGPVHGDHTCTAHLPQEDLGLGTARHLEPRQGGAGGGRWGGKGESEQDGKHHSNTLAPHFKRWSTGLFSAMWKS